MTGRVAMRVLALLQDRGAGKSLCPSEVARDLADGSDAWRGGMADVHHAVDELLSAGSISLSWQGLTLERRDGPYRIGLLE